MVLTILYRFSLNEILSTSSAIIISIPFVVAFFSGSLKLIEISFDLLNEYDELKYEEMLKDK